MGGLAFGLLVLSYGILLAWYALSEQIRTTRNAGRNVFDNNNGRGPVFAINFGNESHKNFLSV